MQFNLAVSAFFCFAAVIVQASPVAMGIVARVPVAQSSDCGVVGGKSCNIVEKTPFAAVAAGPTALSENEMIATIVPRNGLMVL